MTDQIEELKKRLEALKADADLQAEWLHVLIERVGVAEKLLDLLARECVLRVETKNDDRSS